MVYDLELFRRKYRLEGLEKVCLGDHEGSVMSWLLAPSRKSFAIHSHRRLPVGERRCYSAELAGAQGNIRLLVTGLDYCDEYEKGGQVIKYLGSKRRLVGVLGNIAAAVKADTVVDVFTGTTRVAQEFKRRGMTAYAVDKARYSHVLAQCYVECDATSIDKDDLQDALSELNTLPGSPGYFTETFCVKSRYFQPFNGERVDAIREQIETTYRESDLYPILLTSLMEAADRVDSTTGVQMAYLKSWAPRSFNQLELRMPTLLPGVGTAIRGDANQVVLQLPEVDLMYLDPPYNQHSYFGNYHIWETLIAWDKPEVYGVACKRIDCREPENKSVFNSKPRMEAALAEVISNCRTRVLVLSYNNEAWVSLERLMEMCSGHGDVQALAFDSKRYVGAQIGVYNPAGTKVGSVSHLRNLEYVVIAGAGKDLGSISAGPEAQAPLF